MSDLKKITEELKSLKQRVTVLENEMKNMGKVTKKKKGPPRAPSKYNLFMKEQMPILKKKFPNLQQKEIMAKIGEQWSLQKK